MSKEFLGVQMVKGMPGYANQTREPVIVSHTSHPENGKNIKYSSGSGNSIFYIRDQVIKKKKKRMLALSRAQRIKGFEAGPECRTNSSAAQMMTQKTYDVRGIKGGKRCHVKFLSSPGGTVKMKASVVLEQGHAICSREFYSF